MIKWFARLVVICWFLIRYTHGFGSGAPPSQCDSMLPIHSGIQPQTDQIPFILTSSSRTYTAGQTIAVSLLPVQMTYFRGYLIKVLDSSGNPVGTMIPEESSQKTITCGTNVGDSITHTTKLTKDSSAFGWQAPNNLVGIVSFRVTVVQNYTTFWVDHELLGLFPATETAETTTVPAATTSASSDTETSSTAPSTSETEQTTPGVTETPQAQTTFVSTTDSTKLTTTPFPVEVMTNIFTSTPSYSHVTRYNTTQVFHELSNPTQGFTSDFTNNVTTGQLYTGIHNTEGTRASFSPEGNVTLTTKITSASVGDRSNLNDRSGNMGELTNRNITKNSTTDVTDMLGTNITDVQGQLEDMTTVSPLKQFILHTVTRTTRDVSRIEIHGVTTVTLVPSQDSPNVDNTFLTSSPKQKTTIGDQQHLTEQQTVTTRDDAITHIPTSDIPASVDLDSTTVLQRESTQLLEKNTQDIDQYLDTVSHTTADIDSNNATVTDRSDTVTTTSIKSTISISSEAGTSAFSNHMLGTKPNRFLKPKTGKFDKAVQTRRDETTPRISKTLVSLPPVKTSQQDGKIAYDPECGSSKGCFVKCKGENCEFMVTWRDIGNAVRFEIYGKPDGAAPEAWVAVGFSTDTRMGEDSVTECVYTNGMVQAFNSYNPGYSNTRLMNPQHGLSQIQGNYVNGILMCSFVRDKQVPGAPQVFNLEQDWHIMYANGRALSVPAWSISMHSLLPNNYPQTSAVMVDYQSYVVVGSGAKYPLVKAHGCLMIFAWVLFTGVGIVAARYYKNVWVDKTFMKLKIWFQVHRFSMVAAVLCNAIAIIIIFVEVGGYSNIPDIPGKSYLRSHPVIGIIITILSVTNPVMALFRPGPEHSKRPIFNWAHWGVGMAAYILSTICICFGFQLGKSHTPDYAIYIMIVYVTYIIIFDITLEMMEVLAKREKQGKVEQVEMSNVASNGTESSIPNGNSGSKGKVKKTDKTKTLLLAVHMAFTGAFALVLVLVVALN